ncbi:MAG: serine hydrolase domain-containing protein [Vicinamibacterales bacterium]
MRVLHGVLTVFYLATVGCGPTMNEPALPDAEAVRSHLDALVRDSKTPGIQYLVVAPEHTVFEYDGGWADIAGRRPMNAATTMMAYSMSKTITAAAMLQLVEAQKVNLDTPIDRSIDSHPYGAGVTVRQLLSHTSGIPNPIPLAWVHPAARHATFDERAALATVLREHPKLSSAPGAKYGYSNIGYWLLGPIIEKASGESFPSYVSDHVLRPLGITPEELGYVVPDNGTSAKGYLEKYSWMNLLKWFLIDKTLVGGYEGRWLHIHDHYLNGPAFGGLVGTARGFGKFLQDQLRPHSTLFNDTTRQLFNTPVQTNGGTEIPMTLGWHIGTLNGARFLYKEGGGGGFHCMMRVYPSSKTATIVMTNATGFDVRGFLDSADPRFLSTSNGRH